MNRYIGAIVAVLMASNLIAVMWYLILQNGTIAAIGSFILSFVIMFFSAAMASAKNEN